MVEVDLEELRRRLAPAGVTDVTALAGGASSFTFRGARSGGPVVVKVAPPGVEPIAHRDVLRQARILKALAASRVPVPEVLWEEPGDPPITPPLFVMPTPTVSSSSRYSTVARRHPSWPSATAMLPGSWPRCIVWRRATSGWVVNRSSIRSRKSSAGARRWRPSIGRWYDAGKMPATRCYVARQRLWDRVWCMVTSGWVI